MRKRTIQSIYCHRNQSKKSRWILQLNAERTSDERANLTWEHRECSKEEITTKSEINKMREVKLRQVASSKSVEDRSIELPFTVETPINNGGCARTSTGPTQSSLDKDQSFPPEWKSKEQTLQSKSRENDKYLTVEVVRYGEANMQSEPEHERRQWSNESTRERCVFQKRKREGSHVSNSSSPCILGTKNLIYSLVLISL